MLYEVITEVANMTKNAFCKYFKKRTNKSYFSFLNELRIENACKLLISNKEIVITSYSIHYTKLYEGLSRPGNIAVGFSIYFM